MSDALDKAQAELLLQATLRDLILDAELIAER
jgi:hypothetical protein